MVAEPIPIAIELVALLRELVRNQAQINDTQRLMEETLKKLADNKISGEQNGHSADLVLGKANSHPVRSQPSKHRTTTYLQLTVFISSPCLPVTCREIEKI